MRTALIAVTALVLALASARTATAHPALDLALTTYDDGWSCPGDCDAHVVFNKQHNGTRNAFLPAGGSDLLANRDHASDHRCVSGQPCVVCFAEAATSCLVTVYRGSGPPQRRVDATPAFMKETCDKPGLPTAVVKECTRLRQAAAGLAVRINCIETPERSECRERMHAAAAARTADEPELAKCRVLGVAAYNHQQTDAKLHRSPDAGCPYFLNQRKSNSHGVSWMMLSPASCRPATFVGPNGTDCCSGDPLQAAVDLAECRWFYLKAS